MARTRRSSTVQDHGDVDSVPKKENGDLSMLELRTVHGGGMDSSVETLRRFPNSHWES